MASISYHRRDKKRGILALLPKSTGDKILLTLLLLFVVIVVGIFSSLQLAGARSRIKFADLVERNDGTENVGRKAEAIRNVDGSYQNQLIFPPSVDGSYQTQLISPPSYPVIVVGMPKTGTTSISHFFECINKRTSHQFCGERGRPKEECGAVMKTRIEAGLPPFDEIWGYEVYTQLDVTRVKGNFMKWTGVCYYPQIEALKEMHEQYPDATFILSIRNVKDWIKSVYHHQGMNYRIGFCNITGFPPVDRMYLREAMFQKMFLSQIQRVRDFVKKYPSHRLVELDIDANDAGEKMIKTFGGDSNCWMKKNTRKDVQQRASYFAEIKQKHGSIRNYRRSATKKELNEFISTVAT